MTTKASQQTLIPWLLSCCCFTSILAMRACDAILPTLAQEFSVSIGTAAYTISIFAIAYGIFQLLFGPLGDKLGKLFVISLCSLACAISNLLIVFANDIAWLTTYRFISGACAAGIFPLAMAWIGDNVPYQSRQVALVRLVSASVTGMLAGQWLSGILAEHIGWRYTFILIAILFLSASLSLLGQKQQTPRTNNHNNKPNILNILKLTNVRFILIITFTEGLFAFGALAFVPSQLMMDHQISASIAGGIAAFYAIGGFFYTRIAKLLLRHLGEDGLSTYGGLSLLIAYTTFVYIPTLAWAAVACFIAGFGFYCLHNTLQTRATQMAPTARGTAMSLFACVLFLGQSVGTLIAAYLIDLQISYLIFIAAGIGLITLGLITAHNIKTENIKNV